MEWANYIQWVVTSEQAALQPLGFRLQLAYNRWISHVPVDENTFDTTFSPSYAMDFEYDPTKTGDSFTAFPVGGLTGTVEDLTGIPVRYQMRASKFSQSLVAWESGTLQSINCFGREVFDSLDLQVDPIYMAADTLTDNIWLTDSSGVGYVVPSPFCLNQISSRPAVPTTLAVIPDCARAVYWRVDGTTIVLCASGGSVISQRTYALWPPPNQVLAHAISPSTGTLFVIVGNGLTQQLLKVPLSGSLITSNVGVKDVSFWTATGAPAADECLFVSGTNTVYRYTGSDTVVSYTPGSLSQASSISAMKGVAVYVLDASSQTLYKYADFPTPNISSPTPIWSLVLPIPTGEAARIRVLFREQDYGPLIYFWSTTQTGVVFDQGSAGVVAGHFGMRLGTPMLACLPAGVRDTQVWSQIAAVTNFVLQEASSSSSSSSLTTDPSSDSTPWEVG